jgi:hypothetical protein
MFNYINEYIQVNTSSSSAIWIQVTSAVIALAAFIITVINLISLRNAQSLTAKISLINVEVEMRKSYSEFRNLIFDIDNCTDRYESSKLVKKKSVAMERYISLADKLAGLIIFVKAVRQYNKGTDWKNEYLPVFEHVIKTIDGASSMESSLILDLQKNVATVLAEWRTENTPVRRFKRLFKWR